MMIQRKGARPLVSNDDTKDYYDSNDCACFICRFSRLPSRYCAAAAWCRSSRWASLEQKNSLPLAFFSAEFRFWNFSREHRAAAAKKTDYCRRTSKHLQIPLFSL